MKKTILFLFDVNDDNRKGYSYAVKLAEEQNTEIILFTTIAQEGNDAQLDEVYQHLLALNGHFQTMDNNWQRSKVKMQRRIHGGEWSSNLVKVIKGTIIHCIVFQDDFYSRSKINMETLQESHVVFTTNSSRIKKEGI